MRDPRQGSRPAPCIAWLQMSGGDRDVSNSLHPCTFREHIGGHREVCERKRRRLQAERPDDRLWECAGERA
jgi:hypothetical protein